LKSVNEVDFRTLSLWNYTLSTDTDFCSQIT
jgi:hypothetical protein